MTTKPNIVLIVADNLGWGELGCYGGGALRGAPTPRIDALAKSGFCCRTLMWKATVCQPGPR